MEEEEVYKEEEEERFLCLGRRGGERERGVVESFFWSRREESVVDAAERENDAADVCECAERIIACNVFFGRQGARRVRVSAVELRTERLQKSTLHYVCTTPPTKPATRSGRTRATAKHGTGLS